MKNAAKQTNDHKFSQVVNIDIKRSTFNRNSGKKTFLMRVILYPYIWMKCFQVILLT